MKRRHILGAIAAGTGALVVGWGILPPRQRLNPASPLTPETGKTPLNGWVRIGEDDTVSIVMSKSEMGQGVFTGLAMLLADELDARWDQITLESSSYDNIYNNQVAVADGLPFHPDNQGNLKSFAQFMTHKVMREIGLVATGGSSSIKDLWLPMREAGASARAMLVSAAAKQWQVAASECQVKAGVVSHSSGKSAHFGELAKLAALQDAPKQVVLKTPDQFTFIGKAMPRIEGAGKVDGSAMYGMDFRPEGLLFAGVRMNPEVGAPLVSMDANQASAMPGVEKILALAPAKGGSGGVAVVAKSTYQAMKALGMVQVVWGTGAAATWGSEAINKALVQGLDSTDAFTYFERGNAQQAILSATKKITAEYSAPYLAHATMEPMNCTVWLKDGKATVWAPSQIPGAARHLVAEILGIDKDNVTLHLPLLGTGLGRRFELDYIAQAAQIARACDGKPVQTIWDRSQDMQHDFYRPACVSRYQAGIDAQGQVVAWHNHSCSQSIAPQLMRRMLDMPGAGPDKTTAEGAFDQAYEWPHVQISHTAIELPIPIGTWRSVGHSHQAFFKESFVDEVAHATGQHPLAFRLSMLKNHPRHARVLQLAADKAGMGLKPMASAKQGRAWGMALHESFGSIVAQMAEVSVSADQIRVHRVVCAIDCGTAVNPDSIAQQMESSIMMGISAALWGHISFDNGKVQQSNFHDYPLLRLDQAPSVETHIVTSNAHPEGVGEPGTPPIAPAIANAVFALTGQRLRHLPLRLAPAAAMA
ncbi:MAG: xanthine dehydrogenase family protein molybdopterin-binding subunit [Betaproteobacteria bacterium]|nr:xanthine dehydrogenase family protein molybdopterin-binding subunit [Betaproteobacteria bacterium]